jgi:hypothetical protein
MNEKMPELKLGKEYGCGWQKENGILVRHSREQMVLMVEEADYQQYKYAYFGLVPNVAKYGQHAPDFQIFRIKGSGIGNTDFKRE